MLISFQMESHSQDNQSNLIITSKLDSISINHPHSYTLISIDPFKPKHFNKHRHVFIQFLHLLNQHHLHTQPLQPWVLRSHLHVHCHFRHNIQLSSSSSTELCCPSCS